MEKKRKIAGAAANTAWQEQGHWYGNLVGKEGHYYHKEVIFPNLLSFFEPFNEGFLKVLDLGCGDGVLSRFLSKKKCSYVGVDASSTLIQKAVSLNKNKLHQFVLADATKPLKINENEPFTHAIILLALQNMQNVSAVVDNLHNLLAPQGKVILVLNHPCFRIPRQTSWGIDEDRKIQYRRIDKYLTPMEIPIQTHPAKGEYSSSTLTFHQPLSLILNFFFQKGFAIDRFEEWCSNKVSSGKNKKMEDRARAEIPLFLALRAVKM